MFAGRISSKFELIVKCVVVSTSSLEILGYDG